MELLSGRPVAERIDSEVQTLSGQVSRPHLVIYLVGDDPSSVVYAGSKAKRGGALGADVTIRRYRPDISMEEVMDAIDRDSASEDVDGIVLERPLPGSWDRSVLRGSIDPVKDLEAQHPENFGLLALGAPRFVPPTPLGALVLMHHYGMEFAGRNVVVMGRSPTVGLPLAVLLAQKLPWADATVSILNSRTKRPHCALEDADIILTAIGRPGYLKGDMVPKGVRIVDMGINSGPDGKLVGDVDIPSMADVAAAATPTPGGTGAVTVSCMFLNLFRAAALRSGASLRHGDEMIRKIYQ